MAKKTTDKSPSHDIELQVFNFPEYDISIEARNIREAEEKLKKLLSN